MSTKIFRNVLFLDPELPKTIDCYDTSEVEGQGFQLFMPSRVYDLMEGYSFVDLSFKKRITVRIVAFRRFLAKPPVEQKTFTVTHIFLMLGKDNEFYEVACEFVCGSWSVWMFPFPWNSRRLKWEDGPNRMYWAGRFSTT